jgi:dihydrofolate reductase
MRIYRDGQPPRIINATDKVNDGRIEMGKIVISENISLDGVGQDPLGGEGFRHAGWFDQVIGNDRPEWAKLETEEALGAEALLLGRRSYEFFAARWPSRAGEWADRLNSMPKYVVSSSLGTADWNNTTILNGDVVSEIAKLKQERTGEIVIYASFQLVHTLMEHDLIDEVRLLIFPILLGAGERVFDQASDKKPMHLVHTRTVGEGLVHVTYEVVPDA